MDLNSESLTFISSTTINDNTMETQRTLTATFEVGKTYVMGFICDSDLKVNWKCIKRTSSFVTFEDVRNKEQMRRKINTYSGEESVLEGNYSMAPSIRARNVVK